MAYELIEALKKEFWPKKEDVETSPTISNTNVPQEEPKCNYCNNSVRHRAYHLREKIICSKCLNARFDDYINNTFKKITNKTLDEVRKKI